MKTKNITKLLTGFLLVITLSGLVFAADDIMFRVNTCKDPNCFEKAKVFVMSEDIYIEYSGNVDYASVTANLVLPDKTSRELTLPTSIKAEQIGTYNLNIVVSKNGKEILTKKVIFGVIEKEFNIVYVGKCNANGKCDLGENTQSCPQDCPLLAPATGINSLALIIIITIALAVIAFGYVEFSRLKHNRKMEETLELRTYIVNCLGRGYTQNQVKQELVKDGWDITLIDNVFKTLQRPRRATPTQLLQIQNYISINLRKGYTKQQIRNVLIRDGWPANEVEQAFRNLRM